jgi:hypothetical protein
MPACDCNHCRPWAPGEIREMKGKAMQHYLEDAQGLPRGSADESRVADFKRPAWLDLVRGDGENLLVTEEYRIPPGTPRVKVGE